MDNPPGLIVEAGEVGVLVIVLSRAVNQAREGWQKMPKNPEKSAVNVTVEDMADRLVEAEIREGRSKRPFAQREVSRRAGLAPTAIENFQRGRLKNAERISGRIRRVYVAFLERQVSALEAELAFARACDPERDLRTAEAAISDAKAALGQGV